MVIPNSSGYLVGTPGGREVSTYPPWGEVSGCVPQGCMVISSIPVAMSVALLTPVEWQPICDSGWGEQVMPMNQSCSQGKLNPRTFYNVCLEDGIPSH